MPWAMTEPTRKIARQATSAVAFAADPPDEDDPLLGFAPYLHAAPRRNSITPECQRRFVASLAACGVVAQAARSVGKSMEALYKLRARPGAEGFAAAWDAALERGVQRLEDIAMERATLGTPTPIVSGGQLLGMWHKPDNNLLRFMLQNRMPGTYGKDRIVAGHPLYEAIREEVEAECAEREAARERARQERLREIELEEIEWEEEQDRLAEEAEANKTPEERQREGLLHALERWSLEDLIAKVQW